MPKRKYEMNEFKSNQNSCNKITKTEQYSVNSADSEQENKAQNFQEGGHEDETVYFRNKVFENLQEIKAIEQNCMMYQKPESDIADFDGLIRIFFYNTKFRNVSLYLQINFQAWKCI